MNKQVAGTWHYNSLKRPFVSQVEGGSLGGLKWEIRTFRMNFSRWWQLKYFLCSPQKLGKIQILTIIFFKWSETANYIVLEVMKQEFERLHPCDKLFCAHF